LTSGANSRKEPRGALTNLAYPVQAEANGANRNPPTSSAGSLPNTWRCAASRASDRMTTTGARPDTVNARRMQTVCRCGEVMRPAGAFVQCDAAGRAVARAHPPAAPTDDASSPCRSSSVAVALRPESPGFIPTPAAQEPARPRNPRGREPTVRPRGKGPYFARCPGRGPAQVGAVSVTQWAHPTLALAAPIAPHKLVSPPRRQLAIDQMFMSPLGRRAGHAQSTSNCPQRPPRRS